MFEFLDLNFSLHILTQTKGLAFLFGAAIIFSLFLFITARVPFWIRFVGIPIILALTIWGYAQLDNMLGYPYWGVPAEQAILMGYDVQRNPKKELEIVIWAREKEGSRLYVVPWSKEKEEKLQKAIEAMKKGIAVGIKRKKGIEGERYSEGEFVLHEFEKFDYPAKDPQ
jgi:hypothetical protein